jgi:phosphoribosylformimino-5-aminoimidazole carboxamide ribotide isomerase
VGIDARDGKVAVRGWLDQTDVPALDLAQRAAAAGAREVILTDISRDGTLTEPHYSQIAEVVRVVSVPVIASGGVARVDQVVRVRETGAAGVIIGRALYTGDVSLGDALQLAGIA